MLKDVHACVLPLFFIVAVTAFGQDPEPLRKLCAQCKKQFSIEVGFSEIPSFWNWPITCTLATPAEYKDVLRHVTIFRSEFSKYPRTFIKKTNLKKVLFVKNLKYKGLKRSAFPGYKHETLVYDFLEGKSVKQYHNYVVHHEFFHMIDEEINGDVRFVDPEWAKLNDRRFKYGEGGTSLLGDGNAIHYTHPREGFVNTYSMSGLEEDRAEIFASLFIERFSRAVSKWTVKDEILRAKVKHMKTFLRSVDKNFDDAYWKNLFKKKKPKPNKKSLK